MPNYIDADKLIEFIEKRGAGLGVTVANCCNFKDIVKMIPTEEVVSRSEYEKMQRTAEHQQSLAMERWFENNRLKRKIDELEKEVRICK